MHNTARTKAILTVKATTLKAARTWLDKNGFVEVQAPTITPNLGPKPSAIEVEYFGKKAYLTQGLNPYSGSFLRLFPKIYAIAPAFRKEPEPSKRHLTEYLRLEAAARTNLQQILQTQENLIQTICNQVQNLCASELATLNVNRKELDEAKAPFNRITYDQAISQLQALDEKLHWGESLNPKQEAKLSTQHTKPFFIVDFPANVENLLFEQHPQKPELTLTADLIAPNGYGELASSGQIANATAFKRTLKQEEFEPALQKWLLNRLAPEAGLNSGFAIGVERLIQWLCKLEDIKEATLYPRTSNTVYP